MRLSLLTPLLFLTTNVLAAPTPTSATQLDASIMSKAVAEVNSRLKSSISALQALSRAPATSDLTPLERDIERRAADVSRAMRDGADHVRRGADINLFEATALAASFQQMMTLVSESCDAYIRIKPIAVRSAGGREVILNIAMDHAVLAGAFADALKARLPLVNQQAGAMFSAKAQTDLKRVIAAYKN